MNGVDGFILHPSSFILLYLGTSPLNGLKNLLIQLERDVGPQRPGRSVADDLGDLRGVMRRQRQALADNLDLTEPGHELLLQLLAKQPADEIALEVLVIDVHGRYATSTSSPRPVTRGSIPRWRRKE